VAGSTPTLTTIPLSGDYTLYPDDDNCSFETDVPSAGYFNWRLPNGMYYTINTTENTYYDECAIQQSLILSTNIVEFPDTQDDFAYVLSKVAVLPSAIGTPFDTAYDNDFPETFGVDYVTWNQALLQSATACMPVFSKNPVQCSQTGDIVIGTNEVSVSARGCNVSSPIFGVDPKTGAATGAGACTPGSVGQAQIVIGAVNGHAPLLAQIMYDFGNTSPDSYTVLCEVDVAPAITYRTVTYTRQNVQNIFDATWDDFAVSAGSECTPTLQGADWNLPNTGISDIISNSALAMGAAAPWQFFTENSYDNGWWGTLWDASQNRFNAIGLKKRWSFNNSRSPIEEAMGLTVAMTVGAHFGYVYGNGIWLTGSTLSASAIRVGPGEAWALVYVLPQIYSIVLLGYFLLKRRK
jgi:hypothetical protein